MGTLTSAQSNPEAGIPDICSLSSVVTVSLHESDDAEDESESVPDSIWWMEDGGGRIGRRRVTFGTFRVSSIGVGFGEDIMIGCVVGGGVGRSSSSISIG